MDALRGVGGSMGGGNACRGGWSVTRSLARALPKRSLLVRSGSADGKGEKKKKLTSPPFTGKSFPRLTHPSPAPILLSPPLHLFLSPFRRQVSALRKLSAVHKSLRVAKAAK